MPHSTTANGYSSQISDADRTTANWIHLFPLLAAFFNFVVAFPYLGLLASVFFYFNHKDRSEYVRQHARDSLNFQITLAIIWTLYLILSFVAFASFLVRIFSGYMGDGAEMPNFPELGTVIPMIIFGIGLWVSAVVILVLGCLRSSRGQFANYPSFTFIRA